MWRELIRIIMHSYIKMWHAVSSKGNLGLLQLATLSLPKPKMSPNTEGADGAITLLAFFELNMYVVWPEWPSVQPQGRGFVKIKVINSHIQALYYHF